MGLPRFETTTTLHRAPPAKMDFMLGMAAQVRARETVDGYVETYMRRNPAARKTMEAVVMRLTERASDLRFDHLGFLAFAGLDDTVPGVAPILHVFTQLGWTERDAFDLEDGLVHARWYQPPSKDFPMVVVRELRVDRFGEECVEVLRKYLTRSDEDDEELLSTEDVRAAAIVGAAPWNTEHIDDDDMELLTYYSPLLAWHLAHGYAVHQVAGSVNGLTKKIGDGSTRRINATVEDVRAVMEAASSHGGGCPMADPAVKMSSDGSARRVAATGIDPVSRTGWNVGSTNWGGLVFVRRLDGEIVTPGTGIDKQTQLAEAFGFDDEDDTDEGGTEEVETEDGDPEGRAMLEALEMMKDDDSDVDDPLLSSMA